MIYWKAQLHFRGILTGWTDGLTAISEVPQMQIINHASEIEYLMHMDWLYTELLKSISGEKNLGVLVYNKLHMGQQCALSTVKINCILGCGSNSVGSCAREGILLLH